jgi:hypothetical protein
VSGNTAEGNGTGGNICDVGDRPCAGIVVGQGSTASGNTAVNNRGGLGIEVVCPSNVIGNTATFNVGENLVLVGADCNTFQNLEGPAP